MSDQATPAVQREAEGAGETTIVEWCDLKITLPAVIDDWDDETLEQFETGKSVGAIRALLGSDVYDKLRSDFRKLHGRKITVRDLKAFGELIASTYGFGDEGNS